MGFMVNYKTYQLHMLNYRYKSYISIFDENLFRLKLSLIYNSR